MNELLHAIKHVVIIIICEKKRFLFSVKTDEKQFQNFPLSQKKTYCWCDYVDRKHICEYI